MENRKSFCSAALWAAYLAAAAAVPASAQSAEISGLFGSNLSLPSLTEPMRAGFDAGLRMGGVRNPSVRESGTSNWKWLTGGRLTLPVAGGLSVFGEAGYSLAGKTTLTATAINLPQPVSAGLRVNITHFAGGVEYRFRGEDRKVEPFVSGGIGAARMSASASASGSTGSLAISETDLMYTAGGGLRTYLGRSWGLRPEIKVVRVPGETYAHAAVGIFYQFGRR